MVIPWFHFGMNNPVALNLEKKETNTILAWRISTQGEGDARDDSDAILMRYNFVKFGMVNRGFHYGMKNLGTPKF